MLIKNIFENPIDRTINPAVVVGDNTAKTIKAEIKEYVFTREIAENLYKLLSAITGNNSGKTGIWINGYYGSGKSHFLKYAHYCMSADHSEAAFDHFEDCVSKLNLDFAEATPSNIRAIQKRLKAAEIDNILFNVEAVTGDGKTDRLTRIFLNQLNAYRGYNATDIPLALLLEKELDKAGVFTEFKTRLKAQNYDWKMQATTISKLYLDAVLKVAADLLPGLSTDVLRAALKNAGTYEVSINDTLVPELEEYLAGKGPNYRLVFLVDEISQYIGKNKDVLLNLQTIVEALGQRLNHKVWVACTAQQKIDEVADGMDSADKKDEFGKILGRFDTRINLESNDPAFITQKRVLEKNSEGLRVVGDLYRGQQEALNHQFTLGSDLYKGFSSEEDFIQSYPFVPYQFKLIADVFFSFQQLGYVVKEVKDNARSVIGITHYTIKQPEWAEQQVGGFIPFDAFYNGLLHSNLQHAGSRAIGRALDQNAVKDDSFAQRVTKVLFMVAHLSEEVQRIIPPTLEVLTVLLMEEADQNKLELRQQITDVLNKLKAANVIREEEGKFLFYNEDEVAVTNIISNQYVGPDERLKVLHDAFLGKMLDTPKNKRSIGGADFSIGFAIDGKDFSRGDVKVQLSAFERPPLETRTLNFSADELAIGLSDGLMQDATLQEDLTRYFRVESYLGQHASGDAGERAKTNQRFRDRNDALAGSIQKRISSYFLAAPCISGQQFLEASTFTGADPKKRYESMLETHIARINKHLKLAATYPATEEELRKKAKEVQATVVKELTEAERMMNDAISRANDKLDVDTLVKEFSKQPFSWRIPQILGVLLALQQKGVREFTYNNEPRYPNLDFIEKALKTTTRASCIVKASDAISPAEVEAASTAFNHIFNESLAYTTDAVVLLDDMKRKLNSNREAGQKLLEDYPVAPFSEVLKTYTNKVADWASYRDPKPLLTVVVAEQETVQKMHDGFAKLKDFLKRNGDGYKAIGRFVDTNKSNLSSLGAEFSDRATDIKTFLESETPADGYRHIKKAMEELNTALAARRTTRKAETQARYTEIFNALEGEALKAGVEAMGILPDRDALLLKIEKQESLQEIELLYAKAADFRSEYIAKIYDRKDEQEAAKEKGKGNGVPEAKEAVPIYISNITLTINNEEEMETFLVKLKEKMLTMLQKKQTIIIQ